MTTSRVMAAAPTTNGTQRRRVGPPTARAVEREQEIVDTAAELFHRKGYAATTLQDIADAVGILKGSLYYYIDGKEDLLYRITIAIHADAHANLDAARATPGLAADRLRALVEGHVRSFGRRLTWIRVFYTEYASLADERRHHIMQERRDYEAFVQDLLLEGRRDGSLASDLEPWIVGNAVLTMVNTVYLWYRPQRDVDIDTVARTYADLVLRGLQPRP